MPEEQAEKKPTKKPAVRKPAAEKKPTVEKKPAATEEKAPATARYTVAVPLLNIREKASLSSKILGTFSKDEQVEVSSQTPQGFGKLAGRDGYIALDYVKALEGEQP